MVKRLEYFKAERQLRLESSFMSFYMFLAHFCSYAVFSYVINLYAAVLMFSLFDTNGVHFNSLRFKF